MHRPTTPDSYLMLAFQDPEFCTVIKDLASNFPAGVSIAGFDSLCMPCTEVCSPENAYIWRAKTVTAIARSVEPGRPVEKNYIVAVD
jgi:hypothetical protein